MDISSNPAGGAEVLCPEYNREGDSASGRKLIVFANDLTSSFFVNEIPYFLEAFQDVVVVSFKQIREKESKIISQYHLRCISCSARDVNVRVLFRILSWRRLPHVKEEFKKHKLFSRMEIRKRVYIWWYGLFAVLTEHKVAQEFVNKKEPIYLYAYWLSRPAYTVSYLREKYKTDNIRCFSRAHRYDLYEHRNPLNYLPFRSYIEDRLDDIYFISENGKRYFKNKEKDMNGNAANLHVARLGTNNIENIQKDVAEKKKIVLASCSNIIPVKRLDLIVEVMAYLQKKKLPIHWIHLGKGNLCEKTEQDAKNKLQEGSYQFLGFVENDQILKTYQEYDVDYFINMSDSEGIPVSIMEAMSMGIPIIARDVGGNSEIVNEKNGLLLPGEPTERDDIKDMIYDFVCKRLNQVELYQSFSYNARAEWEAKYCAEDNYRKFFRRIINGSDM